MSRSTLEIASPVRTGQFSKNLRQKPNCMSIWLHYPVSFKILCKSLELRRDKLSRYQTHIELVTRGTRASDLRRLVRSSRRRRRSRAQRSIDTLVALSACRPRVPLFPNIA